MSKFSVGKKSGAFSKDLTLVREADKAVIMIFALSFIACLIALVVYSMVNPIDMTQTVIFMAAPFFIAGMFIYVQYKRWLYVVVLLILDVILYYLGVNLNLILLISFLFVGSAGVAGVAVLIQRFMFYRVMTAVEDVNVKDKLSIFDKVIVFLFNIPKDLDTRNITMNYNLKRVSFPWNEMIQTMKLGLVIGMFLWIYISMNPTFMDTDMKGEVPAFLFALVLYMPLLVLPWSIFRSLNVRVETRYRDFALNDGIKETLKRMAVPIFASFMFVLLAINTSGLDRVAMFIVLSVVFNVFIIGLTSLFFYLMFEPPLVDDIVSKWKVFRPVALAMDIGGDVVSDDIPGTPKRDLTNYGSLEFENTKKKK